MTVVWFILGMAIIALAAFAARLWVQSATRRRALETLQWIENSLSGHGHVTGIRWQDKSQFEVPVRLASQVFRMARFTVRVRRPRWPLTSRPARVETLTFYADLDFRPSFQLELHTMRFFARSSPEVSSGSPGWVSDSHAPVVLSTKLEWRPEIVNTMQALLASSQRDDVHMRLQRQSPHFTASMPLGIIDPGADDTCGIFKFIQDVAETAAAKAW